MKVFFVMTFISVFLSTHVLAQDNLRDIEVRISLLGQKNQKILIGEEEPVKLEMSSDFPIHFFQNLVNDKFIFENGIYISSVKELAVTKPGFAMVYEAKAAFMNPVVPKSRYDLALEQMGVRLRFINLNIEVFNDPEIAKVKTPQVLDQEITIPENYAIEIIIALTLLISGLGFGYIYRSKSIARKNKLAKRKEWLNILEKASTRKDFELILYNKDHWQKHIGFSKKSLSLFENTVYEHQFKKEWTPEILSDVKLKHGKLLSNIKEDI